MRRYQAAAKDWSKEFGFKIYDDWGLKNHEKLQWEVCISDDVFGYRHDVVERIFRKLPMPFFRVDDRWKDHYNYHIVMGAISQFNADDIEYFVGQYKADRSRQEKLERYFGKNFYWVLSPKTMDLIENHFGV